MQAAGRAVDAVLGQRETGIAIALYRNAEARQQVQRDVDIGLADQLAVDHHRHRPGCGGQWQGQQQRAQELARYVAADMDRLGAGQDAPGLAVQAMHSQRRVAGLAQVVHRAAELAQRIDQVANRPLVHPRHARQRETAALQAGQQRQGGGQGPHRGAGVAQEQLGLVDEQTAGQTRDRGAAVGKRVDAAAQRAQRGQHHPGVIGVQQVVQHGGAGGQSGQQQHPVRDRLGARQTHRASGAAQRWQVKKGDVVHRSRAMLEGRMPLAFRCRRGRCCCRSANWRGHPTRS